jgi:hypothetical protein
MNKKTNNNLDKVLKISMMITVKFLFILIKMDHQNGCVLNSLLLNKMQKLEELDLFKIIKLKKMIDLKKEILVQYIQDHKFKV